MNLPEGYIEALCEIAQFFQEVLPVLSVLWTHKPLGRSGQKNGSSNVQPIAGLLIAGCKKMQHISNYLAVCLGVSTESRLILDLNEYAVLSGGFRPQNGIWSHITDDVYHKFGIWIPITRILKYLITKPSDEVRKGACIRSGIRNGYVVCVAFSESCAEEILKRFLPKAFMSYHNDTSR